MTSITELKRNNENDPFHSKSNFILVLIQTENKKLKQEFGTPPGDLTEKKLGIKFN